VLAFLAVTFVVGSLVAELSRSMPPTTHNRKKLSTFHFPLPTIFVNLRRYLNLLINMKKNLSTFNFSLSTIYRVFAVVFGNLYNSNMNNGVGVEMLPKRC